ncbi:ephrin-A4 [Alligator sinensis]|uniref:Ephrin-A4 n=1 Tax=Alligator sinensis TaxID=38654 RepID=A0A3Q0H8K0_ALLSI|nr:ephrin-A4 [Alligator sinensis]
MWGALDRAAGWGGVHAMLCVWGSSLCHAHPRGSGSEPRHAEDSALVMAAWDGFITWGEVQRVLRPQGLCGVAPPPLTPVPHRFLRGDYTVQLAINDYLDIYCPHYEQPLPVGQPETFTLFMVDLEGYRGCHETPGAFKRWECARPHAPFGPVRFSEKIQRFTPFSLGFEFQPGETYYYISIPSPDSAGRCLRLRVFVCCKVTTTKPVTEVPRSQPRGRGEPGAPGLPAPSRAAPSRLRGQGPCLSLAFLPLLWI